MPGHRGRLDEDSGVHERRDRAGDGLGVFEPMLGWWWRKSWRSRSE
jgi:hypothetical protein